MRITPVVQNHPYIVFIIAWRHFAPLGAFPSPLDAFLSPLGALLSPLGALH